ncbi:MULTISPECIES: hypothetical protein [Pseudomonas]|uniref:hypothetical protein n=1 Tax=Pseudomonas TaxID=286 RepID=UPI00235E39FD|nr:MULTISPECIES: hypothetical protein [Pseudomonas]WJV25662.1 hypothetical protein PSR66_06400 [Pseudomonas chlororaphis]
MTKQTLYGQLALIYSGQLLPLQILSSNAGYFIGTADNEGPVSRESVEYFASRDQACRAFARGQWQQRDHP